MRTRRRIIASSRTRVNNRNGLNLAPLNIISYDTSHLNQVDHAAESSSYSRAYPKFQIFAPKKTSSSNRTRDLVLGQKKKIRVAANFPHAFLSIKVVSCGS